MKMLITASRSTVFRDTSKLGAATMTDDFFVLVLVILGLTVAPVIVEKAFAIAPVVVEKAFEALKKAFKTRRLVTLGLDSSKSTAARVGREGEGARERLGEQDASQHQRAGERRRVR